MRKKKLPPKKDSEENRQLAFNYSLKYLSFRPRSVKEAYDYLVRKNFTEDTINHILKRLIDLKFLNDEDFGRLWIESRQKYKGKSKFILKSELRLKGLNRELIDELVSESMDELEAAKIAFEKKKKLYSKFSKEEFNKKMAAFLSRRGFSYDIIRKLLKD